MAMSLTFFASRNDWKNETCTSRRTLTRFAIAAWTAAASFLSVTFAAASWSFSSGAKSLAGATPNGQGGPA